MSKKPVFCRTSSARRHAEFKQVICVVILVLYGLTFSASRLRAQSVSATGTISGTIYDSSGAVIVDAGVELQQTATKIVLNRATNRDGLYTFPSLQVGSYQVKVTASGFRTALANTVVQVGQISVVNVRMQPGAYTQTLQVTGSTSLLQTTDPSNSTVIGRTLLSELPLNGRRYTDFSLITPNATEDGQTGLVSFGGEQGGEDTGYANGNGANFFTLDGANATSNYFGNARGGERVPYIFGQNAIQEFAAMVSPYSAAYGGGATGFVNTVTRSGTDTFHGNTFYYNQNSATGANAASNDQNGIPKPYNQLQQFGGAFGGPIVRSKAWFFVDYEQQLQTNPISVINTDYSSLTGEDFGVPAGAPLPPPNGPLPIPSSLTAPDPTNPVYLQQVSNALNAIQSSLGTQSRSRNDWTLFGKLNYNPTPKDQLYLSLNFNRFDSPHGEVTSTSTALYGISTLSNAYVRDYQAALGWTHAIGSNTVNDLRVGYAYDRQYATPAGLVSPRLPSVLLEAPSEFEMGNAGFAAGSTKEWVVEVTDRVQRGWGKHNLSLGVEANVTQVTDSAFGGFDPDAQRQNGTLTGTYAFSSLIGFALGQYDTLAQATGNPNFSFKVLYFAFYAQDQYRALPTLTLDFGLREDFQVYPQPRENPAFPLTGQFPNQYQRLAPRFGFAWQLHPDTVVRGGFGWFYENFNGLNYRNSVITNGLVTQQSSALVNYDPNLAPNRQAAVFPNQIHDPSLFSAPNISIVSPSFRFPYVLQSSLQVEQQILRNTTLTLGTIWTHGVHLISSSAYDLNLIPPTGTTTYIMCPLNATQISCNGTQVTLPNLDSGLLQEGRINPSLGQINALISPGINNYNSFYMQLQRTMSSGLAVQASYTWAKNIMSNGVDFNNQFDFSNTHAPYLLDQRQRVVLSAVYQPGQVRHFQSSFANGLLSNWSMSTKMLFSSGRPYAALLTSACTIDPGVTNLTQAKCTGASNGVNDSAINQTTANSALGINGAGPSPVVGLDSYYGPWTRQIDLSLARSFKIRERQNITIQAEVFNVLNHPNWYVQNGNGVNALQYQPTGSTCGDGRTLNQTCYLVPQSAFGSLQIVNALYGPRVFQFAARWSF